jgi:hypothetical protein
MNRTLALTSWREAQSEHKTRASALTLGRRTRRKSGERDPVDDFMFESHRYTPKKLDTWFPGVGTTLEIDSVNTFDFPNYNSNGTACELDAQYLIKQQSRIDSTLELLRNTQIREATFNCFGLHEWAMVYQADQHEIRHGDPLRVNQDQINSLIGELGLRCTHIDAFRFFTAEAAPQNVNRLNIIPTRDNQKDIEQSGCLHANMDLYKHCMWFHPMIPGDLVLDCFELARSARTLDMRASPYDLSPYGYEPIAIETSAGRREYVEWQREIAAKAEPLRERLRATLNKALAVGNK